MINEINFLPESFLKRHQRKRRIMREIGLVVVVVICLFVWISATSSRAIGLKNYVEAKTQELEAAEAQLVELSRLKKQMAGLNQQIDLHRRLSLPVTHTSLLAAIGESMPDDIALTRVEMTTPTPKPTNKPKKTSKSKKSVKSKREQTKAEPKEPRLMKFEMTGLSPSDLMVANFVGRLSEHVLFHNVKMKYTRSTRVGEVTARKFGIELTVDLNQQYMPTEQQAGGLADAR